MSASNHVLRGSFTAVACALALLASTATADVGGDVGLGIPSTSSVIAANPSLGVDRVTGAGQASYPFVLPAARGGAQPSLGLTYNSGAGTRDAGVGWGLELPKIERHNLAGAPKYFNDGSTDFILNPPDRLEFNGRPIVPICVVPSYVCPKQEVMPPWANGWRYFRLQEEGMFARLFWSPDSLTWRVQTTSGELLELGVPSDDPSDKGAVDFDRYVTPGPAPFRWNISRQIDAPTMAGVANNFVRYQWQALGTLGIGFLTDEYHTLAGGAAPSSTAYAHHTHLTWEPQPYASMSHARIWRAVSDRRLKRVDVTSAVGSGPRQLVRRYHLSYDDFIRGYPTHHSFLSMVSLEGRCSGQQAEPLSEDTGCPRLPPTVMTYSQQGTWAYPLALTADKPFRNAYTARVPMPIILDINGDGLPDFVQAQDADAATGAAGMDVFLNGADPHHLSAYHLTYAAGAVDAVRAPPIVADTRTVLSTREGLSVLGDWLGNGKISVAWSFQGDHADDYLWPLKNGDGSWTWKGTAASGLAQISAGAIPVDLDADGILEFTSKVIASDGSRVSRVQWTDRPGSRSAGITNMKATLDVTPPSKKFFADMNGDGLPDLVTLNIPTVGPNLTQSMSYIPGDGTGVFDAPPQEMKLPQLYANYPPNPALVFVHDVNGDGYADLIYDNVETTPDAEILAVSYNQDGQLFGSGGVTIPASLIPGWSSWTPVASTALYFADMNGNGVDDLVFVPVDGSNPVFVDVTAPPPPNDTGNGEVAHGGLLASMTTSGGAHTDIFYRSTADLTRAAQAAGKPWSTTSPQVAFVVGRVRTQSGTSPQKGGWDRTVTYDYRDPAYDGWSRRLLGFRSVSSTEVGEDPQHSSVLETTYLFDDLCQDATSFGCGGATDDSEHRPLRGVPVLSEVRDGAGNYHSTAHSEYQLQTLMTGIDGRHVRFAYVAQSDTFAYDVATLDAIAQSFAVPDVVGGAPRSVTIRKAGAEQLQTSAVVSDRGETRQTVDAGRVVDHGSGVDSPITRRFAFGQPPGDASGWMSRVFSETAVGNGVPDRTTTYEYDAAGRIKRVHASLSGGLKLGRHHEAGASVAPEPPTASNASDVVLATYTYGSGPGGNVATVAGANGQCTGIGYDPSFDELPVFQTAYRDGCGSDSTALVTMTLFDRGLGVPTLQETPAGGLSTVDYDGFGRLRAAHETDPAIPFRTSTAYPAVSVEYYDFEPAPRRVHVQVLEDSSGTMRNSWRYVDGNGATVLSLQEADAVADGAKWVASGQGAVLIVTRRLAVSAPGLAA